MPDILIRGMEMPATCWNCKLKVGFSACGLVTDHKDGGFFYRVHEGKSRPDWCPLLPLPEGHGELIDKQAFIADIAGFIECMTSVGAVVDGELLWGKLLDALANAKTIVPAEGGTEDDGNA